MQHKVVLCSKELNWRVVLFLLQFDLIYSQNLVGCFEVHLHHLHFGLLHWLLQIQIVIKLISNDFHIAFLIISWLLPESATWVLFLQSSFGPCFVEIVVWVIKPTQASYIRSGGILLHIKGVDDGASFGYYTLYRYCFILAILPLRLLGLLPASNEPVRLSKVNTQLVRLMLTRQVQRGVARKSTITRPFPRLFVHSNPLHPELVLFTRKVLVVTIFALMSWRSLNWCLTISRFCLASYHSLLSIHHLRIQPICLCLCIYRYIGISSISLYPKYTSLLFLHCIPSFLSKSLSSLLLLPLFLKQLILCRRAVIKSWVLLRYNWVRIIILVFFANRR